MEKSLTKKKGKLGAYENKETKNGEKNSLSLSLSLSPRSHLRAPPTPPP